MKRILAAGFMWLVFGCATVQAGGNGNRLAYLDEFCNPYYVGLNTAKLVTPQWVGEPGVEAVVVLSIDDMRDSAPYEAYLRPILERLKKIDGRGPVSIMTPRIAIDDPQLAPWFREGVSIEAHTYDHPCPCLKGGDFARSKATYDRCIDLLMQIPEQKPVAFRMPCCDSMNSVGPRFFAEMFNRTTPEGNFLQLNSSVFMLFTPEDPALPRPLVIDDRGRERLDKYVPRDRNFVNYVEDYPYPYVIAKLCWEMPSPIPDDWQGHNQFGPHHETTVADMKAALDAAVAKQGTFTLTFHPGRWIRNDQVIELVDHAVAGREGKVKFLNFREVLARLTTNLLAGHPLRAANGQDNGVRVLDVNGDGFMDVLLGNEKVRRTRLWSPSTGTWRESGFPVAMVTVDDQGNRRDAGVRFGIVQESGAASFLVSNETHSGLWHFDGDRWVRDPRGLEGLDAGGPILTSQNGRDRGVRLVDLDIDGRCELLVGSHAAPAVFAWVPAGGWKRLPFTLPEGTAIVDDQGADAGFRLVDVDADTHPDIVFSDARRYLVARFVSMAEGWSQTMLEGRRSDQPPSDDNEKRKNPDEKKKDIPPIVRADGTNNGVWFARNHLWVQNEETGGTLPNQIDLRPFSDLLGAGRERP